MKKKNVEELCEEKRKPIKKVREYYPEKEVFEQSKKHIKWTFGLDLSIIEQVALKQYIAPVLDTLEGICAENRAKGIIGASNEYEPVAEVITQFMMDYYDLPFELAFVHTSGKNADLYNYHQKEFNEYLRRVQERKHMP